MRMVMQCVAALAATWLGTSGASAEMVTAQDPVALSEIMKADGFPVEMQTDSQGDPKIRSETAGTEFDVLFYGCTNGKGCAYVILQAYFRSKTYSLKNADDWNSIGIYGFVALGDSTNPALAMMVNLSEGGVDRTNFDDTLKRWTKSISRFKEDAPGLE